MYSYNVKLCYIGGFGNIIAKSTYKTVKNIHDSINIASINTDSVTLDTTPGDEIISLGNLGAGAKPDVAYSLARSNEALKSFTAGGDVVIIVAGLGKGTGTGGGLAIAEDAKAQGKKVFALLRTPHRDIEGSYVANISDEYLQKYRDVTDGILTMSNEVINNLAEDKNISTIEELVEHSAQYYVQALETLVSLISRDGGKAGQNADLNDLATVVSGDLFAVNQVQTIDGDISLDFSVYGIDPKFAKSALVIVETPTKGDNAVNELKARAKAFSIINSTLSNDVIMLTGTHKNHSLSGKLNILVLLSGFDRDLVKTEAGIRGHAKRYNWDSVKLAEELAKAGIQDNSLAASGNYAEHTTAGNNN